MTTPTSSILLLLPFSLTLATLALAQEQVHLAPTGIDTEMHVSWAELSSCSSTGTVTYLTKGGGSPKSVQGSSYLFKTLMTDPICLWDATMTDLEPNTLYTYTISNAAAADFSANFTSFPNNQRADGKMYCVYSDLGLDNDVSLTQIVADAQNGVYDMVLHSGDLAYDLNTAGGTRGNDFMNGIQGAAALVPYVVSPGNHEHTANFSHYKARFYAYEQTAKNSNSENMLYYSFNDDLVHFISIDTEIYRYCNGTASLCTSQIDAQLSWIEQDLSTVDRSKTPWVIVLSHKAGWMDMLGSANFSKIESMFQSAGVDLLLIGHQHNYNRLLPQDNGVVEECYSADYSTYTDCTKMVTMVVGSPGCRENISKGSAPHGVAKLVLAYGFGRLQVNNATHLHWVWEEIGQRNLDTGAFEPKVGAESDEMFIIKNSHMSK